MNYITGYWLTKITFYFAHRQILKLGEFVFILEKNVVARKLLGFRPFIKTCNI
jgi:hypothetical protein